MKKLNQLKGGVILSYISLIVSNGISIVYTPIMLRLLGQSEYGLYNLVSSFVAYLGVMDFGFSSTYMRYYVQYKHKNSENEVASLNGMFLVVFSIIGMCVLALGLGMCQFSDQIFGSKLNTYELITAKKLMILLVINMAITFPNKLFQVYINANERFVFAKTLNMIKTVVNPFIMLPLLLMGYKSYAMVLVTFIYSIVIDIINIFYCFVRLKMKVLFHCFNWNLMKGIAKFSVFVFLGEIVDQINWNVDKFVLGRTQGTVAVAIYGVAAQLNDYFRQFSSNISAVFIPRVNTIVAKSKQDNVSLTDLMIKVGKVQFIILMLIASGFILVGRMFCVLWAGADYSEAYNIAVILMLSSIIPLIQNTGIHILLAKDKHRFRSIVYTIIAVGNVLISIPLSMRLSGVGCAIGTAMAILVGNGFIINWYYKRLGIDIVRFWKAILQLSKGLVLPLMLGGVTFFFHVPYKWSVLLCMIALYVIIYLSSMYLFGFNKEDREYYTRSLLRIRNDIK